MAAVIMGVGLLGLAGLQLYALQANSSAYYRTLAVEQARDLADRMRSNRNQEGIYTGFSAAAAIPGSPDACMDLTSPCNPGALAMADYSRWNTTNAADLPNGQGLVCIDDSPDDGTDRANPGCNGGSLLVVKIWWQDEKNAALGLQRYSMSFSL